MKVFMQIKQAGKTTGKSLAIALLGIAAVCISCKPEEEKETDQKTLLGHGLLVLNEGLINMNNSTLSYYDFRSKSLTGDIFNQKNNRSLGDNAQDMKVYGGKMYIVVNGSSQLEVVDLYTGESLRRIPLFDPQNRPRQPRNITFWRSKAYLCCFDGSVLRIDTAHLLVEASVQAGRNPEDLCVANGKLYVSNSGGLSFPNYDSTVSVINLSTFEEIKKIKVHLNPMTIIADNDRDVYLLSAGNYEDKKPSFQRIDAHSDEVCAGISVDGVRFCISDGKAYLWGMNYATNQTYIQTYLLPSMSLTGNFITDQTSIKIPYTVWVNPSTKDVYIADAQKHTSQATVYCFDANGKKKFQFEAGINPCRIVLVN
jgi:DNA-binding beta-propeller fold protein YncE